MAGLHRRASRQSGYIAGSDPTYVGVLMGVWVTPRMSLSHALLALGLTGPVLIAMRYEERDLARTFWPALQPLARSGAMEAEPPPCTCLISVPNSTICAE